MDVSSEVTSSYVGEKDDDELELGLGLSLGGGGLKSKNGASGSGWVGQYARILTAKDFGTNNTNNNCCSSSSNSGGTKRSATDSVSPPSVVGWPPVSKAHRMPSLAKSPTENHASATEQNKSTNRTTGVKDYSDERKVTSNNKYRSVKVNMDGAPIGRKVDLNAYTSYEMLAQTLEEMFWGRRSSTVAARPSKLLDGTSEFVLTYEDKDGDCMLVGDVPWVMFLSSVKRLRIMKNSESNELASSFQHNNERHRSDAV